MQYYIREPNDNEIRGPFTVQELAEGISTGRFFREIPASSDLGDTPEQLRKFRAYLHLLERFRYCVITDL